MSTLTELFVHPDFRRRGVGNRLIKAHFRLAYQLGYRAACVRTSISQLAIINTYMGQYHFLMLRTQNVVTIKLIYGAEQSAPDTRVLMAGPVPIIHSSVLTSKLTTSPNFP